MFNDSVTESTKGGCKLKETNIYAHNPLMYVHIEKDGNVQQ